MKNPTKKHNYTYNITPYIYYYIYLIKIQKQILHKQQNKYKLYI